ncbi:hypothetical protein [Dyadobacter fermentans]|nr:hypothetical protein [Dyadobacter fermentans]
MSKEHGPEGDPVYSNSGTTHVSAPSEPPNHSAGGPEGASRQIGV